MSATDVTKLNYWCITQLISTLKTDISSDNTRVRIFFFVAQSANFFQNLTLGYMTKTLNHIIFFYLHQNQNFFFQQHWESEFRKKNINPPSPLKLNGRSLSILDNQKRNVLNFQGQHHINKMGQIQFLLEINHNLKTMLNFLAGLN